MYTVHEMIGNFSTEVFRSESFNEVRDYLESRLDKEETVDKEDEAEVENFFSYFSIEEVH